MAQGPSLEEQLRALDARLQESEEYSWRVRRDARSWAQTLGVAIPQRSVLAQTRGLDQLRAAVVEAAATALMQLPAAVASAAAVEWATRAIQAAAAAPARLQLACVPEAVPEAPGGVAAPAAGEASEAPAERASVPCAPCVPSGFSTAHVHGPTNHLITGRLEAIVLRSRS